MDIKKRVIFLRLRKISVKIVMSTGPNPMYISNNHFTTAGSYLFLFVILYVNCNEQIQI